MPVVEIQLLAGRSKVLHERLIARVTDAVVESLGVKPEKVIVLLHEVAREHWGVAGVPRTDPLPVPPEPTNEGR